MKSPNHILLALATLLALACTNAVEPQENLQPSTQSLSPVVRVLESNCLPDPNAYGCGALEVYIAYPAGKQELILHLIVDQDLILNSGRGSGQESPKQNPVQGAELLSFEKGPIPHYCSDVVYTNAEVPKIHKLAKEDLQVDFQLIEETMCLQVEVVKLVPGADLKKFSDLDFSGRFVVPVFPPIPG